MKRLNKKHALPAFLLIAILAMNLGCSKTVYETIKSNPSHADIYWGESSSGLIESGEKTPYYHSDTESKIKHRCVQVRKEGYHHSPIYCRQKNELSFLINVDLLPIPLTPVKHASGEDKPIQTGMQKRHVTIAWEYKKPNTILGFEIQKRKASDDNFAVVGVIGPNQTSYTDTAIVPGTTYHYRLRAYDANTKSDFAEIRVEILDDGSVIQK